MLHVVAWLWRIEMRDSFLRLVAIAASSAMIYLATGCDSSRKGMPSAAPSSGAPQTEAIGFPIPAPSVILAAQGKARTVSAAVLYLSGSSFIDGSEHRTTVIDTNASFTPDWTSGADAIDKAAYAVYGFDLEGEPGANAIKSDWVVPPVDNGHYWLGFSDWDKDCWRWYNGAESDTLQLSGAGLFQFRQPVTADMLVAVVLLGTDQPQLGGLRISYNMPPQAALRATPQSGTEPLLVELTAAGSADHDGAITDYEWDLDGNGVFNEAENGEDAFRTLTDCEYTYTAGNWSPALRVTDNSGMTDIATLQICVESDNAAPEALLSVSPNSGSAPLTVSLNAGDSHDSDGEIVQYLWDWDGNGNGPWDFDSGADPTAVHEYEAPGRYDAWVCVIDDKGASSTSHHGVSVLDVDNQAPDAELTADCVAGECPLDVQFDASASIDNDGTIAKYEWDWDGDGNGPWDFDSGTETLVLHTYDTGNPCQTWIRVTDDDGSTDTTWVDINTWVPSRPGDWYMLGRDRQHSNTSAYAGPTDTSWSWNFGVGENITTQPVFTADGIIYLGTWDGNIYAMLPDGFVIWTYNSGGGGISATPAIDSKGSIYYGTMGGQICALNPNGTLKWMIEGGSTIMGIAVGEDDTIYCTEFWGALYALNPDGTEKWEFSPSQSMLCMPTIAPAGWICVSDIDGTVYAINPDGTEKWRYETNDQAIVSAFIDTSNNIYCGGAGGHIYSIDADGELNWYNDAGFIGYKTPLLMPDGHILVRTSNDWSEFNKTTGVLLNSGPFAPTSECTPILDANGAMYYGCDDNYIAKQVADLPSPPQWQYMTFEKVDYPPAISNDGRLYFSSGVRFYCIGHSSP
jgi:large repetitive protein